MNAMAKFVMLAPIPGLLVVVILGMPGVLVGGPWTALHVAGLALIGSGFAMLIVARWQLGDAFSIEPRATELVTRGLYARIRNPVYVFGLVLLSGVLLYLQQPQLLPLLVPIAIMQWVRAGREAKVLVAHFGDAYRAYRAKTWI